MDARFGRAALALALALSPMAGRSAPARDAVGGAGSGTSSTTLGDFTFRIGASGGGSSGQPAHGSLSISVEAWYSLTVSVTCLVVSGGTAVVGGEIVSSDNASAPVGSGATFLVYDAGQGGQDIVGLVGLSASPPPPTDPLCGFSFGLYDPMGLTSGNLVVTDATP